MNAKYKQRGGRGNTINTIKNSTIIGGRVIKNEGLCVLVLYSCIVDTTLAILLLVSHYPY